MELPPELKQALERLQTGITDAADLEALRRALQAGQIALATGERAVALGGSAEGVVIVTGEGNVVQVLQGPAAETVQRLSPQSLDSLTERYLHRLAEAWQSLTVSVHGEERHPPLERVFFMLQARQRPEPKPTEPPRADIETTQTRLEDAGYVWPLDWPQPKEKDAGSKSKDEKSLPALPPPPPPVPLETVLGKGENLVLLGEPGAGKSTALQFIGLCFARAAENWHVERLKVNRAYIPIRLDLQTSAASIATSEALIDVLRAEVRGRLQCSPAEAEALLEAWKTSPGLLVLFDGLDEVPADLRETVRRRIETFAQSGAAWVILTSRPAGFQSLSGLNEYTLKPFEHPETEALPYLRGWLAVLKEKEWTAEHAESEARTLLEKMQARPALRRLLDNPLLLRLSAQHYALSGEIARNRADLYRLWVEEAWQRATRRGAKEEEKRHFLQALEALAWHLHTGGGNEEADLLQALQKFGLAQDETAAADLLRRLREQTGLLARLPQSEEGKVRLRYAFSHQTLREYFVALRLQRAWEQDARRTWRFLQPRLHLPDWREPLALLVGALSEAEALRLLNWILRARSPEERFLRRDLFLTAELAAESGHAEAMWERLWPRLRRALNEEWWVRQAVPETLGEIGVPAVPTLMEALKNWDGDVRRAAAEALGKIGDLQAVPALIEALKDDKEWVRWKVAEALGKIGDPQAIPALMEVLKDEDWRVRQAAADALGKIGDRQAVPALLETLKDWYGDVSRAAEALGEIGVPAVPALMEALKNWDWQVRWAAAWALGKIGDLQAVPALMEALKDEDKDVRQTAAEALGKIGVPAVPALMEALKDEDWRVRQAAARALGEIGDPQALPALIQALKDEYVREAVEEALGKIGVPAVPALIEALKDDDEDVRRAAAGALGEIGDPQAVPALIEALKDDDEYVRRAAVGALGKIGDLQAVPALLEALKDRDEYVRWAAVGALGEIGMLAVSAVLEALKAEVWRVRLAVARALGEIGVPAVPALLDALKAEEWRVRQVAGALGKIGEQQAVPALIQALKDENENVREAAARALRKIGGPHALPALLEALKDDDWRVREAAAGALRKIGDRQALPALLEALKDEEWWMRRAAAWALGEIGDRQALPALIQALKDEDLRVRQAAAWALGEIGDPQAVPALMEALKDSGGWVRQEVAEVAAEALSKLLPASLPQNKRERRVWQKVLASIRRAARRVKDYKLLIAVLERQAAWQAALSLWRDPLQPPPVPAWQVWAQRAGGGALALLLAGLLALAMALLAGLRKPLEEATRAFGQAWPLWAVALIVVVLGAAGALLGWLVDALRKK
jgi:HEAT repeat protein